MRKKTGRLLRQIALVALLAGCAGLFPHTQLTGTWKDEGYRERLDKVLVIGLSEQETLRRIFESRFAEELKLAGVSAVPGYEILPGQQKLEKDEILQAIGGRDLNSIIVTKLLNQTREKRIITDVERTGVPPYYHPYYDYRGRPYYYPERFYHDTWYRDYAFSYDTIRQYEVEISTVTLETNVYDVATEKPVWSAISETKYEESRQEKVIDSYVRKVVEKLAVDGLL